MGIGNYLKEARIKNGISQETLSEKLGVSRQTISSWESNKSYPDTENIIKLSDLYDVTTDKLLKENKNRLHNNENSIKRKVRDKNGKIPLGSLLRTQNYFSAENDYRFNKYHTKIGSIIDNIKSITIEATIIKFKIEEFNGGGMIELEIKDETGNMTAILVERGNEEFREVANKIVNSKQYLMAGDTVMNDEVFGGKILLVRAIKVLYYDN